ncbi:MAG: hypothetical protein ACI4K7_08325 [Oscillospiraceae bacterium]
MDNFHECLVTKKSSGADIAKKVGIALLAVILSLAVMIFFMVIFPMNIFAVAGIFYGAYYLSGNFSVEYEYIITNDEMDIDKIIGKRKRKRLITAPVGKFERFGKIEDAPSLPDGYTTVLASDGTDTDDYFCDFNHQNFGNVRIIFTPDEQTVENITEHLPNLLKAELRRKKLLDKT